jgi:hypothetical protein
MRSRVGTWWQSADTLRPDLTALQKIKDDTPVFPPCPEGRIALTGHHVDVPFYLDGGMALHSTFASFE